MDNRELKYPEPSRNLVWTDTEGDLWVFASGRWFYYEPDGRHWEPVGPWSVIEIDPDSNSLPWSWKA